MSTFGQLLKAVKRTRVHISLRPAGAMSKRPDVGLSCDDEFYAEDDFASKASGAARRRMCETGVRALLPPPVVHRTQESSISRGRETGRNHELRM